MPLTEEGLVLVPGLLSRWARLPTGARAHYVTAGETGPNVVLLHGAVAGSSGTAGWRFIAPVLAEHGFRVFCPDLPAFGISEGVNEAYVPGPAGTVDFLDDFVESLCLDRFHVAGNSQGCTTAMNYMVAHPHRVTSFAGIATATDMHGAVDPHEVARRRPSAGAKVFSNPFDGTEDWMRTMMGSLVHRDGVIDDDLVKMRTLAARRNEVALKARLEATANPDANTIARLNQKGRFSGLTIPSIYLCGLDDVTSTLELFEFQEDSLANLQFFYVHDCGHQAQSDQPEIISRVFVEFFRDGQVSRATAEDAGVSRRRPFLSVVATQ